MTAENSGPFPREAALTEPFAVPRERALRRVDAAAALRNPPFSNDNAKFY